MRVLGKVKDRKPFCQVPDSKPPELVGWEGAKPQSDSEVELLSLQGGGDFEGIAGRAGFQGGDRVFFKCESLPHEINRRAFFADKAVGEEGELGIFPGGSAVSAAQVSSCIKGA